MLKLERHGFVRMVRITLILAAVCVLPLATAVNPAAEEAGPEETRKEWQPEPPLRMPEKFDWIQLVSDEWLKGEIVAMYDRKLEFDSDELDLLTIDWEDAKQIRTAQVMQVQFLGHILATGRMRLEGDNVIIIDDQGQEQEFEKSKVLTITAGEPREVNYWSGKVSVGATVRQGNIDQVDSNMQVNVKRRTVNNRIVFDLFANYGSVDDIDTVDNQRASVKWDKFITDRFFIFPASGEYYRDPFQNIASRVTFGVGVGYQLVDTKRTDWQVSGGPAIQETRFESVAAGEDESTSTGALTVGTELDIELNKAIDFIYNYRFQLTDEVSGSYNHHMVMSFETEWTSYLDFDISLVWDRIEDPQPDALGEIPKQDDYRMILAIGVDF